MMGRKWARKVVATGVAVAVIGIGSTAAGQPTSQTKPPPLVGRWQMVTTCQQFVQSLRQVGLEKLAPAMIAGNGLVTGTPAQLAAKTNICEGAIPRVHSHFFTRNGGFGSLDWNRKQVDDGGYKIISAGSFRIGPRAVFRYRIIDGKHLRLTPVLTTAAKQEALADPLAFSEAGWMVAVSLPAGGAWKRVPCAGWC
jgi:hypothetical protein